MKTTKFNVAKKAIEVIDYSSAKGIDTFNIFIETEKYLKNNYGKDWKLTHSYTVDYDKYITTIYLTIFEYQSL